MAKGINYRQYMKKALHGFVADVLGQVARSGLPGKHYFFITFETTHPGVDMNPALKARYPEEMTIVLQEWFADLAVMKDRFTVTLNFGGTPEPIVIPFEALKTFVDPSVEFGVKFDAYEAEVPPVEDEEDQAAPAAPAAARDAAKDADGDVVSLDKWRKH